MELSAYGIVRSGQLRLRQKFKWNKLEQSKQ